MIISEFAKYLQEHNDKLLTRKTTPLKLLHEWLKQVINKNPKTNIDKNCGGKLNSGRVCGGKTNSAPLRC